MIGNCIGGIMDSVLVSSAVDRDRLKPKTI